MTPEKPAEIGKLFMVLNVTGKVGPSAKLFLLNHPKHGPTLPMK
jgi:hypothetical protein